MKSTPLPTAIKKYLRTAEIFCIVIRGTIQIYSSINRGWEQEIWEYCYFFTNSKLY